METITFERGNSPKNSMGIGLIAEYRRKKIEAVRNQNFEEAANWRTKEIELLKENEA